MTRAIGDIAKDLEGAISDLVDRIIEARDRPSRRQPGVMSSLDFADDVLQILGEYGR